MVNLINFILLIKRLLLIRAVKCAMLFWLALPVIIPFGLTHYSFNEIRVVALNDYEFENRTTVVLYRIIFETWHGLVNWSWIDSALTLIQNFMGFLNDDVLKIWADFWRGILWLVIFDNQRCLFLDSFLLFIRIHALYFLFWWLLFRFLFDLWLCDLRLSNNIRCGSCISYAVSIFVI